MKTLTTDKNFSADKVQQKMLHSEKPAVYLVIVAAGSSTRMGGIKKEYLKLESGTVLSKCVRTFLKTFPIKKIAVAIPKGGKDDAEKAVFSDSEILSLIDNTMLMFVEGGKTRQESVLNALLALKQNSADFSSGKAKSENNDLVLIHDGARPFVTKKIILDTIAAAKEFGAAVPALQPVDTQKEKDENGFIKRHLQRENLAAVQTPQTFLLEPLLEAHKKAARDGKTYTDDTEIWGKYCGNVKIVEGDSVNKKITYPSDLVSCGLELSAIQKTTDGAYKATESSLGGTSLESCQKANCSKILESNEQKKENSTKDKKMIRTGLGYDLHKLAEGRKLIIGGIEIPFEKGELGHSDGDVLLHAITDALLGACGMGDIGSFFPPEEAKWKDADSKELLKTVWNKITSEGWALENLDCVIALEKPKFLPYREKVIDSIAEILEVQSNQVFVKAKTGEKIGKIGRGEAIEAFATCLLSRKAD